MAKGVNEFLSENSEQVQELRAQLAEKDRILDNYKKDHGKLEVLFGSLLSSVSAMDAQPIFYNPQKESSSYEIEAVFQNTDWHIGEVQDADEIEGINAFNLDIATSRVDDLIRRENRIIEQFRPSYIIKNGVVICTGDMISGDLRNESTRTNEFDVPIQVVKSAELFAGGVMGLAQNMDYLRVEYITADNHSRLTHKPESKNQGTNSFNYLVAIIAEKLLSRQNNIDFRIHIEPQKVINVLGRQYLTMHGHQIKGWAGIPFYGMERKTSKESQGRLSMSMDDPSRIEDLGFHKIVGGHLHTPITTDYYWFGGSLSGTNAYDRDNGRYSLSSQPMWFVDPKYGEFGRIDFKL